MKKSKVFLIIASILIVAAVIFITYSKDTLPKNVLFLLPELDFDHKEFTAPKTMLEDAGIKVTLASTIVGEIVDNEGVKYNSDLLFKDVDLKDYGMLIIVGGTGGGEKGVTGLCNNQDLMSLLQSANEKNMYIGGICYGPVIIARSGILKDREATVYRSPWNIEDITNSGAIYKNKRLVVSDNIFTAATPSEYKLFGEKILEIYGVSKQ